MQRGGRVDRAWDIVTIGVTEVGKEAVQAQAIEDLYDRPVIAAGELPAGRQHSQAGLSSLCCSASALAHPSGKTCHQRVEALVQAFVRRDLQPGRTAGFVDPQVICGATLHQRQYIDKPGLAAALHQHRRHQDFFFVTSNYAIHR